MPGTITAHGDVACKCKVNVACNFLSVFSFCSTLASFCVYLFFILKRCSFAVFDCDSDHRFIVPCVHFHTIAIVVVK